MTITIKWDGAPIRQAFGACNVVADGVATLPNGKRYRVHASATRGYRKPEVVLFHLMPSVRAVPEGQLPAIRAAVLEAWAAVLQPLRAAYVAEAQRRDAEYLAERDGIPPHAPMIQGADEGTNEFIARAKAHREAGGLPMWSGKGAPPAVGSVVRDHNGAEITITGYEVRCGYLMALGRRGDETGNLAGAEIAYPDVPAEIARHTATIAVVAAQADYGAALALGDRAAIAAADERLQAAAKHLGERQKEG